MKKFLFLALSLFIAVSCYDDSALWEEIKDHENRIVKLETLCNQMNTNITSLQTIVSALQSNDFITNVSPVTENGKEIGYTITFSKSGTITIYHGKDGKDGENGKDGTDGEDGKDGKDGQNGQDGAAPVIGVKQDTDGVYYWTLNGDWLRDSDGNKIPTTGKDGKDGEDGADGADGEDGAPGHDGAPGQDGTDGSEGVPGQDGEDGTTPKLKIEEGYWYVSYDNGKTWERLEKAVEESDDCFFKNVSQDKTAVCFTLTDGTVITIPLRQALSISFEIPEITEVTYDGYTCCVPYTITGFVGKYEIGFTDGFAAAATIEQNEDGTGVIIVNFDDPGSRITVYVSNNGHSVLKTLELEAPIIEFKDEAVGAACVSYFDLNGDGKLSFREAATVTDLSGFRLPDEGKLFNEFQYFTSLEILDFSSSLSATGLIEISLPEGLTEIHGHLYMPSLQSIKMPSSLKRMEAYLFRSFHALKKIQIKSIEDWLKIEFVEITSFGSGDIYPLFNPGRIELIVEDGNLDYIIPDGTTVVKPGPLTGLGIKTITLPSSVTAIEDNAFKACGFLEKINIPSSVKSIGVDAFLGCSSLKEIHISSFEEWQDIDFEDTYSNPLVASSGVLIDKNGNQIKAVSLPEGTTVIKSGMFAGFDDIEHVSIPSTVTTIEANAFAGCYNLKEITLPEGVESIGDMAFYNCKKLKEITLPKSLKSIGADAFVACPSVEQVHIESVEHWLSIDFTDELSSPLSSSVPYGNPCLVDKTGNIITSIGIPEGTTVIQTGPYCGLAGLEVLDIPSSVTTIEPYAFYFCNNLKKVTVPSSVSSYNDAFRGLSSLEEVILQDGLRVVSAGAFSGCKGLTEITLPEGLETIGQNAFNGTGLTEITIPSSVKTIDDNAFSFCRGLTEINLPKGLETIGFMAFGYCDSLSEIIVPSSVKTMSSAFVQCIALKEVMFNEGIEIIPLHAFQGCTSLEELVFPSSVVQLTGGLWECTSLSKLYFRNSTPPVLQDRNLRVSEDCKIYVPYNAVGAYKSAESWAYHRTAIIGYDFENGKVVE